MRLALGSSRPTDFFGLPTQNGRQNPFGRIDYSSWGNSEALSHDYNRRRGAIVAEPKRTNCELNTDGKLRPSGRRIKKSDAVKSKRDTRHSNVLAYTRRCARKYKGCEQHPIPPVPRLRNAIATGEHVPSRQQVSEALVCARRNQQHPQLSKDTPR